jgi:hypothetical protein
MQQAAGSQLAAAAGIAQPGGPPAGMQAAGWHTPSDLSPALIGRERGLALAGRASRQNYCPTAESCLQAARYSVLDPIPAGAVGQITS